MLLKVARPKLELRWCLLELPSSPPNVLSASLKFSLVLIKPLEFLQKMYMTSACKILKDIVSYVYTTKKNTYLSFFQLLILLFSALRN